MNASQLYEGDIYAYFENPPRGRTPLGAAKVRLRDVETRKSRYNTNRRTYAKITVITPGNNREEMMIFGNHGYCKEGDNLTVPARHIIDFWTDYEAEVSLLREEREQRNRERRRADLRVQMLQTVIGWHLQRRGIPFIAPMVDLYDDNSGFVKIQLAEVLIWLGIDLAEIDAEVDRELTEKENDESEA